MTVKLITSQEDEGSRESNTMDERVAGILSLCTEALKELSTTREDMRSVHIRIGNLEDSLQSLLAAAKELPGDFQQNKESASCTVANAVDAGSKLKSGPLPPPCMLDVGVRRRFQRNLVRPPPAFPNTNEQLRAKLGEQIDARRREQGCHSRQASSDRSSSVGSTYRSGSCSNGSRSPSNRVSSVSSMTRMSFESVPEPGEEPPTQVDGVHSVETKVYESWSSALMDQHELFIEAFHDEVSSGRPILLSVVNNLFRMRCQRELQYKLHGYRQLRDFLADIPGLEVGGERTQMNVSIVEPIQYEAYRQKLAHRREMIDKHEGRHTMPRFERPPPLPHALQEQVRKLFSGMKGSRVPLNGFMKAWQTLYPNQHLPYRNYGHRDLCAFLNSLPFLAKLGSKGDISYRLKEASTQERVGELPGLISPSPLMPKLTRAGPFSSARANAPHSVELGARACGPPAPDKGWKSPFGRREMTRDAPLADPTVVRIAAPPVPPGITVHHEESKIDQNTAMPEDSTTASNSVSLVGHMVRTAREDAFLDKPLTSGAERSRVGSPCSRSGSFSPARAHAAHIVEFADRTLPLIPKGWKSPFARREVPLGEVCGARDAPSADPMIAWIAAPAVPPGVTAHQEESHVDRSNALPEDVSHEKPLSSEAKRSRVESPCSRSGSLSPVRAHAAHDLEVGDRTRGPAAPNMGCRHSFALRASQLSGDCGNRDVQSADPKVARISAPVVLPGIVVAQGEDEVNRSIAFPEETANVPNSVSLVRSSASPAQEAFPVSPLRSEAKRTYFISPTALEAPVDIHNVLQTEVHANEACMICSFSTGQVMVANGRCRDLLGGRGMHIVRQSFSSFVHDDDRDAAAKYLSHAISSKQTEIVEPLRLRLVDFTGLAVPTCITGKCLRSSWWLLVLSRD